MQSKKHSSFQRSFGRIKSRKLRDGNVRLMKEVLPRVQFLCHPREGVDFKIPVFTGMTPTETWLEIGFGGGEHLAHRAIQNPNVGIIGCEPFINGAVKLLREIEEKNLQNIRIHNGDVREILSALPEDLFSRIFILFPDPWPKKKHNKRRIISHETLDMLAKHLKKNGIINVATDHVDYAKWIVRHFLEREDFTWEAKNAGDWQNWFSGHVETKYQKKALTAGRNALFFTFSKN